MDSGLSLSLTLELVLSLPTLKTAICDTCRSIGSAVKEKSLKPIHESRTPVSSRLVRISRSVIIALINDAFLNHFPGKRASEERVITIP